MLKINKPLFKRLLLDPERTPQRLKHINFKTYTQVHNYLFSIALYILGLNKYFWNKKYLETKSENPMQKNMKILEQVKTLKRRKTKKKLQTNH